MKYPKGVVNNNSKNIEYKHRGMGLEDDINMTNQYYVDKEVAFIYKKPTPIQATKIEYVNNRKIIKEGYFKEPSTTDYNGLYNGKYIDFEAKETSSLTSFPLSNIHSHQIKHINNIINGGGTCFIIVRFTKLNKTYLLLGKDLIEYIDKSDKKSIPKKYFEEKAYIIEDKYMPRVDYLEVINSIWR
jgi:recombination protein U